MGGWGVACTGRRSRGRAERGLSKSPPVLGEDEESASKIQRRVCKAAPIFGGRRKTVSSEPERRRRRAEEETEREHFKAPSEDHFLEAAHLRGPGEEREPHPGAASGGPGGEGVVSTPP